MLAFVLQHFIPSARLCIPILIPLIYSSGIDIYSPSLWFRSTCTNESESRFTNTRAATRFDFNLMLARTAKGLLGGGSAWGSKLESTRGTKPTRECCNERNKFYSVFLVLLFTLFRPRAGVIDVRFTAKRVLRIHEWHNFIGFFWKLFGFFFYVTIVMRVHVQWIYIHWMYINFKKNSICI